MYRLSILLSLAIAAGLFYWIAQSGVIENNFGDASPGLDRFVLESVAIKIYDRTGVHIVTVYGKTALVSKDFNTVEIEDIRVVDRRSSPPAVLTAKKGKRTLKRKVEQLEFSGDVFARGAGGNSLETERLFFYPRENVLETSTPSVVHSTGTTISGDFIQSSTTLKKGVIKGHVEITRVGTDSLGRRRRVVMKGDVCRFDLPAGRYDLSGNVDIVQGDLKLTCNEAVYEVERARAVATGQVAATDPDIILTCDELYYLLDDDVIRVSAAPDSPSTPSVSRTTYRVPGDPSTWLLSELHCRRLEYARTLGRLEAEEDVFVVRWVLAPGGNLKRDFEISADRLHSQYGADGGKARKHSGRSNFFGHVRIESSDIGASGNRAIFYEDTRNFYVIGNARAWNYDDKGRRINVISGGKILHDGKRKRNIVIEAVRGSFTGGGR